MNRTENLSYMWTDKREVLVDRITLCIKLPLLDQLGRHQGPKFTAEIRNIIERRIAKVTESSILFWLDSCVIVPVAQTTSRSMLDTMLEGLYERLIAPFSVSLSTDKNGASDWYLTPFIGIKYPPHANYEEAIRCSKAAAHRACAEEMTKACLYDPSLESHEAMDLLQHQFLLKSIREETLAFHYQPQIEIDSGRLKGFEMLIRPAASKDPRLAFMSPKQMIRIASETNLIVSLTELAVRTALRTAEQWRAYTDYQFQLSVNVDPYTLIAGWDSIISLLIASSARRNLLIEITEIERASNKYELAVLSQRLAKLQEMGVEVALDDFGTGLANLDRIAELPFNELKFDKEVIHRAAENPVDAAIVQVLVASIQASGCRVVAEGIETPEQWELCRSMGCDIGQGYLLGKPQPSHQALAFLKRQAQREQDAWRIIGAQLPQKKISKS